MTDDSVISKLEEIGGTLESSLTTLDRTRTIVDFFEGCISDRFNLTPEEREVFLKGTQKIRKTLNYVMSEIENAENQVFSLGNKLNPEYDMMYSVVIDSLDKVTKDD